MLVDSHCHLDRLDLTPFAGDLSLALQAARNAGVEQFLCVAIDQQNQADVLALADAYPDIWASVGIHPLHTEGQSAEVASLCETARHPKVVAVGETGLDYFYAKETMAAQQALFRTHIQAAVAANLPLIVHSRDAREETIRLLKEEGADRVGGVLHCFTESLAMAEQAMELGFYISFSGIVTFKNADELRQVAMAIPADRILVETDSPYLTPAPHRGKPNSPRHVADVARCLAELRGQKYQDFCEQTSCNFQRLFLSRKMVNAA